MPEPEPTVDAHPHQLSGGQRQRIMIALAVALGSGLVIAHEPSPALDATIRAQIRTVIKDVRHPEGTAALPSTHALGAITEIADRVVIM